MSCPRPNKSGHICGIRILGPQGACLVRRPDRIIRFAGMAQSQRKALHYLCILAHLGQLAIGIGGSAPVFPGERRLPLLG